MCSSAAGETKLSWFREKPRVPGQNRVVDTTNDAFGSDKCLDCQSGATSRPPRRENRACGGSDSSSNVLVVTPERHSCRVVARAKRERTLEAEWVRAPHKNTREVHVRNTSRVASPTPFGVQKQNWRVRRLVSSRRGPPFFASGGTHRSRRPGRWVWRAGCAMVAEARPTLYHDVYQRRDRNRATLRGAHPRTTARWRPQKCRRRRKARRFSRSVRLATRRASVRCEAQSLDLPAQYFRSRACGVSRRTR
jgi:hypothetical protein